MTWLYLFPLLVLAYWVVWKIQTDKAEKPEVKTRIHRSGWDGEIHY